MNIQTVALEFAINLIPVITLVYLFVAFRFSISKSKESYRYFSWMMLACALYSFGYFLEIKSLDLQTILAVRIFEYLGVIFIPSFGVLFVRSLTSEKLIKKRARHLLYLFSLFLWIGFCTNPYHQLFYKEIRLFIGEYGAAPVTTKGPGYFILLLYYGVFIFCSSLFLGRALKKAKRADLKTRLRFSLIAFQLPWLSVLFILAGLDKYVDLAPLTILIVCSLFAINGIRNDMFDVKLSRWKRVFNTVNAPAFLVDGEDMLTSLNNAASEWIPKTAKLPEEICHILAQNKLSKKPLFFVLYNEGHWLEVRRELYDDKSHLTSIVLNDITEEKNNALLTEHLFNSIGDFALICAEDGKILFYNELVKNTLGYSDEEIKKMSVYDLHPDEMKEDAINLFAKIIEGTEKESRLPFKTKVGKLIPVETRVWIGSWNGNRVVYGMSKDISLLKETEMRFEKSFMENPAAMAIKDFSTNCYKNVNKAFVNKFGYTKEEVIGKTPDELNLFSDPQSNRYIREYLVTNGSFSGLEMDIYTKDKSKLTGLFYGEVIETGNSLELLTVMIDITEIKLAHEKIRSSEEQLQLLISQMQQGLAVHEMIYDEHGAPIDYRFISINDSFERITGLKKADLIGKTVLETLPATERYWIDVYGKVASTGEPIQYENYSSEVDRYFSISAYSPKKDQFAVIVTDITDRKKTLDEIEFLSYHDQLTGLYNRRYFEDILHKMSEGGILPLTLIMADVNGLKLTNDAFGHQMGDALLKKVAQLLSQDCPDESILSRIGGDEFVILCPHSDEVATEKWVQNFKVALKNEKLGNLILSVSIGYSVKTREDQTMEEIFKQAEDDMYRHKLSESLSMRSRTIELIMNSLYEKNVREMQHSKRVGDLCKEIAKEVGFEKDDINELKIAGLMHDIGKIGIDERILNNPRKLNRLEKIEVERHCEIGYRILGSVSDFSKISTYVLEHHEKWDGSGYPKGLVGDQISLQARIIAVADSFDAMISDRPYRPAMTEVEAIEELRQCAGKQFDPGIVQIFIEKVLGKNPDQK